MDDQKLRIGFFSDSYFPEVDGVTYTLKAWKERLKERGHEVHIIYPDSPDYDSGKNEISVFSVPNPFYSGYRIPIPLFRGKYPELDLVHCHSPAFLGISGLRYAKKDDLPAVYTHHTPLEEYFEQSLYIDFFANLLEKIYLPVERFILQKFDVLTSSTEEPRRSLDFKKLPVGIDMDFFQPRSDTFFEEDLKRPILGYSGRISSEKNPMELLEMAENFDGTLVIIGEGPMDEEIENKKPENVVTMDFLKRERLPVFYSSIDVFVTASTGDTLGLSTLEANACGTPVVAPDVMPFKETIKENNGDLYEKADLEDFRKKIRKVLEKDMATRDIVKKYSLSSAIDELEEIYLDLK